MRFVITAGSLSVEFEQLAPEKISIVARDDWGRVLVETTLNIRSARERSRFCASLDMQLSMALEPVLFDAAMRLDVRRGRKSR